MLNLWKWPSCQCLLHLFHFHVKFMKMTILTGKCLFCPPTFITLTHILYLLQFHVAEYLVFGFWSTLVWLRWRRLSRWRNTIYRASYQLIKIDSLFSFILVPCSPWTWWVAQQAKKSIRCLNTTTLFIKLQYFPFRKV